MPVPLLSVIPMGIITVLFAPLRHNLDNWDRMMMRRDYRITGSTRGQAHNPEAPPEFATNSFWSTERV
ncbi:hypothetical protein CBS9595_002582 [Malassezia furfur]|nr:hypothetical protein CBS9595_002582 [Malassezia furfur]